MAFLFIVITACVTVCGMNCNLINERFTCSRSADIPKGSRVLRSLKTANKMICGLLCVRLYDCHFFIYGSVSRGCFMFECLQHEDFCDQQPVKPRERNQLCLPFNNSACTDVCKSSADMILYKFSIFTSRSSGSGTADDIEIRVEGSCGHLSFVLYNPDEVTLKRGGMDYGHFRGEYICDIESMEVNMLHKCTEDGWRPFQIMITYKYKETDIMRRFVMQDYLGDDEAGDVTGVTCRPIGIDELSSDCSVIQRCEHITPADAFSPFMFW